MKGKQVNSVSVATSSITGVEILPSSAKGDYILFADNPHNLKKFNRVLITGLSTTSSKIGGSYPVGVSSIDLLWLVLEHHPLVLELLVLPNCHLF